MVLSHTLGVFLSFVIRQVEKSLYPANRSEPDEVAIFSDIPPDTVVSPRRIYTPSVNTDHGG